MQNKISRILSIPLICLTMLFTGCRIVVSLSGASIPPEAKTFSVAYFPNNATMVAPILSSTLTDALQEKFAKQTSLDQVNEGGDLALEGEIINYVSAPSSISSDEYAQMNRLTITVQVRFTNAIEPQWNFNRSFSGYEEYDANTLLQSIETSLIQTIVDQLSEDIFNACVSNW